MSKHLPYWNKKIKRSRNNSLDPCSYHCILVLLVLLGRNNCNPCLYFLFSVVFPLNPLNQAVVPTINQNSYFQYQQKTPCGHLLTGCLIFNLLCLSSLVCPTFKCSALNSFSICYVLLLWSTQSQRLRFCLFVSDFFKVYFQSRFLPELWGPQNGFFHILTWMSVHSS